MNKNIFRFVDELTPAMGLDCVRIAIYNELNIKTFKLKTGRSLKLKGFVKVVKRGRPIKYSTTAKGLKELKY